MLPRYLLLEPAPLSGTRLRLLEFSLVWGIVACALFLGYRNLYAPGTGPWDPGSLRGDFSAECG
jgi:hypothetical protein